jgi:hypothetical protein
MFFSPGYTLAQQLKSYANFNTVTFEGRVFDATIAKGAYGEFLAITIITNLQDGDEGITVTFNDGNGLMKLHQQGYFDKGRRVHVTGAISGISEVYEKDGEIHVRKRPQLMLDSKTVQVKLGAAPASDKPAAGTKVIRKVVATTPAVDPTPSVTEESAELLSSDNY